MIKQVDNLVKDKKIKVFSIIRAAGSAGSKTKYRCYNKTQSGEVASYWAHYRSISGKEFANINANAIRRQAIYTINYHSDVDEGMYVEDLTTHRVYLIKHVDRKEGYTGDLALSVLETKEADGVAAEPEEEVSGS